MMRIDRVDWYEMKIDGLDEAAERSVRVGGEALLERANQTVPFEEGDLASTGHVDTDPSSGELVEGSVSYDSPYAVRLHENPDYDFQGSGRGKWLELTAQESAGELEKAMAVPLEEAIK